MAGWDQIFFQGPAATSSKSIRPGSDKERREGLRFVAMASMGATRLAVDTWLAQDGKRPLAKCIQDAFKTLKAEI